MILFFKRKINLVILVLAYIGFANPIFAQSVSVSFTKGFIGTRAGNGADSIMNFTTLQIYKASFSQSGNNTGLFVGSGPQGNDVRGTITLYSSSGTTISLNGYVSWRVNTGVFGFVLDAGQSATINYGSGSTYLIRGGGCTHWK